MVHFEGEKICLQLMRLRGKTVYDRCTVGLRGELPIAPAALRGQGGARRGGGDYP